MKQDHLFKIARFSHVHTLFRPLYGGTGSILMFHRIARKDASPRIEKNKRNEVPQEFLESIVNHLLAEGCEIVSLDEVYRILTGERSARRFVSFTFDDGYEDVYSLAYPVFKRHGLPFAVYVCTNYPDKRAVLWWYLLEDLVLKNERIVFVHNSRSYSFPSGTGEQKESAFHSLRRMFIEKSTDAMEALLTDIFEPYGMDVFAYSRKLALDWNQITIMSEDPLVTIGAHTVNHYALSRLEARQAEEEILRSREIIENHIGRKVEHFSYPFGSKAEAGRREFDLVRAAGFKTATTTRIGNIFPGHRDHLTCLPRIPVSGNRADLLSLEVFLSGYISAMNNRFRRVITG